MSAHTFLQSKRIVGFGLWITALLTVAGACGQSGSSDAVEGSGGTIAGSGGQGSGSTTASGGDPSSSGGAGSASGGSDPGAGGSAGGNGDSVTWATDIAPLIYRECVGCHREDGIAPFSLEAYSDAAPIASILADEIEEGHMPPMPVDGSGACNTYKNARQLSDSEIALFKKWADTGAAEGDPSLAPDLPTAPPDLEADVTLDPGVTYLPNDARPDDYRCFLVDPELEEDTFLIGYQVHPGNDHEVHHVIAYAPDDEDAELEAEELDASEDGPGYTCFGGSGVSAEPRVLWAPGGGITELPEGTGLPLVAGRKLILQIHYNLEHGAEPDRTTVSLKTTPSVAHPAVFTPIADLEMVLAPGEEHAETTRTFPAGGQAAVVHGVLPHMHTLGRTLNLSARADDKDHCIVSVDDWDFHWQGAWWYDTPLTFESISSITLTCGYDTRKRTEEVRWGEGTMDEMCLTYLYVTRPD